MLVSAGSGPIRGAEKVALQLMDCVDRTRYRWVVLTSQPPLAQACEERRIPTKLCRLRRLPVQSTRPEHFLDLARFVVSVARQMKLHKVDLVHINNGDACAQVLPVAWLFNTPTLVHIHSPWSRKMQFLLALHHADRIVGCSRAVLSGFESDPVARPRLQVIYNGFDPPALPKNGRELSRSDFGLSPDSIALGIVAVLQGQKEIEVAIEALRHLPSEIRSRAVLVVVGDGPARHALEQRASGLKVEFLGWRPDVHQLWQRIIDFCIVTSPYEGFSIALLEAAAYRVPRIAVDAGGNTESILHNVDGVIVPRRDPKAIADAISALVRAPDRAARLAEAAWQRLRSDFSEGQFIDGFTSVYDDIIAARPPSRVERAQSFLRSAWSQLTTKHNDKGV